MLRLVLLFDKVPRYIVGESEKEASKEGRSLTDFRYACVGYSVYLDQKSRSTDAQEAQTELPVCVGLEVFSSLYFKVCFIPCFVLSCVLE